MQIIKGMQSGAESREPYRSDLLALQTMSNRPSAACCS
jgi:hypothetical protein